MQEIRFELIKVNFHIVKKNTLVVTGVYPDDDPKGQEIHILVNGKDVKCEHDVLNGPSIRMQYMEQHMNVGDEHNFYVSIDERLEGINDVRIISVDLGEDIDEILNSNDELDGHTVKYMPVDMLKDLRDKVQLIVDTIEEDEGVTKIVGWCVAREHIELSLSSNGDRVDCDIKWVYRRDIVNTYKELDEDSKCGFIISISNATAGKMILEARGQHQSGSVEITKNKGVKYIEEKQPNIFYKAVRFYKKHGFKRTVRRCIEKFIPIKRMRLQNDYDAFRKKYGVTDKELEEQKGIHFDYEPLISICIPLYRTNEKFFKELIESFQKQTYSNWELCLADGSILIDDNGKTSGEDCTLQEVVESIDDDRLKYQLLDCNLGIADNTNAALKMAKGDFIALCDHDDLVSPNALYEFVKAINEHPGVDVLYSDEDKIDKSSKKYFEPHFKPDYNIDLLRSINYICHMLCFRKSLLEKAGEFQSDYDGAQDHDMIFRLCEVANEIYHVPMVLYHWRVHNQSTAQNIGNKTYAITGGCKAIEAHYKRVGIPATVEYNQERCVYRTYYHWDKEPLVSVIIPNKDHIDDLQKCIDSIIKKSIYRNLEFIIIENNSTEVETFEYYKELGEDYIKTVEANEFTDSKYTPSIRVVYYDGNFNYSKINNFGVEYATGEYILLLNNDTEIIAPEAIKEMVDIAIREDVGIVGAKLYYPDDTIQHAGVIIGFGGIAGHAFIGLDKSEDGYLCRPWEVQDLSAVTAACLLTTREVWDEVGGLDESFEVAFNDIDYCMKVLHQAHKLVVYNPYAEFYHYESKSRGAEDNPEKIKRFHGEIEKFVNKWSEEMEKGDPYYNPNLTLDSSHFELK
ncbi:MAG: glycosyltransferase family 2 protein [Lachnospiraceae bacterium]|nr:glycosyltransferase family 2 protein [Lachnospiraceae bacterium]